jgi:hypothetical protein
MVAPQALQHGNWLLRSDEWTVEVSLGFSAWRMLIESDLRCNTRSRHLYDAHPRSMQFESYNSVLGCGPVS